MNSFTIEKSSYKACVQLVAWGKVTLLKARYVPHIMSGKFLKLFILFNLLKSLMRKGYHHFTIEEIAEGDWPPNVFFFKL